MKRKIMFSSNRQIFIVYLISKYCSNIL